MNTIPPDEHPRNTDWFYPDQLDQDDRATYMRFWRLPDGRLCGLQRLLFHYTVHVDIFAFGYSDRYCFITAELALDAMSRWDGTGDPDNWHRHPTTGRRRPDADPAREHIEY